MRPARRTSGQLVLAWLACVVIGALLASCAAPTPAPDATATPEPTAAIVAKPTAEPASPTPAPSLPKPTARPRPNADPSAYLKLPTLARGYLTTPNELRRIAALAAAKAEPYRAAVKSELAFAADALARPPIDPPKLININDDINNPPYFSTGAKYVYAWALAYNLLRDSDPETAEEYAQRARDWIMALPAEGTQVKDYDHNTRLNLSVYTQNFVYAADLLADWTPSGQAEPFGSSADAQQFKQWLGEVIVRYPYNAAFTRVNNWGAWGRLTTAVIADYIGDAAPLYVQGIVKNQDGAYEVSPEYACDSGTLENCVKVDAHTMYSDALQLHVAAVDGKMREFSFASCDGSGSQSMIRPDGGIPDELRRQYDCDTTAIADHYGAAARYSQFALEAMVSLAELAWRRGDTSIYTHVDAATGRGALYRGVQFLIDNNVTLTRGSMLEMVNRFYTYQVAAEPNQPAAAEYQRLLAHDLPGILKRQGEWPEGAGFVSFGTLTHSFAPGEQIMPPPAVRPR
ncbi:MAG TPA: alginate lyase family protein [Kouleothrix sp.]|uniref:alginate lyase family protein n=1 Tax=Kouleothrix sp. TaxID=2779161 RepID=UPI002CEEAEA9|nr:alginate lyase family protein [Kouleothrix sp.]